MTPETIRRHVVPVPRYTSYPTAPHFTAGIGPAEYATWLGGLANDTKLSLYVHIPFCTALCWYCGCSTKAAARYGPVTSYLEVLEAEIASVAARLPKSHRVTNIHWGGGSPNILAAADIARLDAAIRRNFRVEPDAEFAVEIDPRGLGDDQAAAFAQAGVNRVSIGVQDFDPGVQAAINRVQDFDLTRRAVESLRAHGIDAVNIDLVYGLPRQTRHSVVETLEKVLTLRPSRVAAFGYAHLPSRFKHQMMIDARTLPDAVERYAQSRRIGRVLERAGYQAIGIDHFALPTDPLAGAHVRRNFQGYTTDDADVLIGLGASAIGHLPQGYVQNAATVGQYRTSIEERGLATVRGVALTEDDRVRAFAIEQLMCEFRFSGAALERRFGKAARPVIEDAQSVLELDRDGFVAPTADGFAVTEQGRPFVRTICACFDAYLGDDGTRHAIAV